MSKSIDTNIDGTCNSCFSRDNSCAYITARKGSIGENSPSLTCKGCRDKYPGTWRYWRPVASPAQAAKERARAAGLRAEAARIEAQVARAEEVVARAAVAETQAEIDRLTGKGPQIDSIEVTRSEFGSDMEGTFTSVEALERVASAMVTREGEDLRPGTYRKTHFLITWTDGEKWSGRWDIEASNLDFEKRMRDFLTHLDENADSFPLSGDLVEGARKILGEGYALR